MSKKNSATSTPAKVQEQKESAAKIAAQKLMTPPVNNASMMAPAIPATPEPTLFDRLADIDRRAKERAEQEKQALAGQYVKDSKANFLRLLSLSTDEALKASWEEFEKLSKLVGGSTASTAPAPSTPREGGTRTRRTKEEMEALKAHYPAWAKRIHAIVKEAGEIKSTDLASKLEAEGIETNGSVKDFVKKFGNLTLKTTGEKRATVYSV